MAIYRNKSMSIKNKKNPRYKFGVALLLTFSPILLNLLLNFALLFNSFFLGVFGLSIYAISAFFIVLGIMFMLNKKVNVNTSIIIYSIFSVALFITLLHISTSAHLFESNYYLAACYTSKLTAGGILSALIVYPIYYIMHSVGAFVFFAIALLIFVTLLINSYHTHYNLMKSAIKLKNNQVDNVKENKEQQFQKQPMFDEKIFIKDEEPSTIIEPIASTKDRERILNLLGLKKQHEKANANGNDLAKNQQNKKFFDIFKQSSGENKQEKEKPPVFIHTEEEMKSDNSQAVFLPDKPQKMSEKERKNLEFIYSIQGKEMPQVNSSKPFEFNFNTNIDSLTNHYNNDKQLHDANFDYNAYEQNEQFTNNLQSVFGGPSEQYGGQPNNFPQNNSYMNNYLNNQFDNKPQQQSQQEGINNINSRPENFDIYDSNLTKKDYLNNKTTFINNIDKVNANLTPFNKIESNIDNGFINNKKSNSQISIDEMGKSENNPVEFKKRWDKQSKKYIKPPIELLDNIAPLDDDDEEDLAYKAEILEETLNNFKIPAKVCSIMKGPAFTRFEMQMPAGISVKRITNYVEDIAMSLESYGDIRTEIPIPGKNAFGVEVPNKNVSVVGLRDILESASFQNSKSLLTFGLGKDIAGECIVTRLEKMPHMLVAGATNSGKSVCLNSLIISLIYKASPEDLRFILIDPKRVEFTFYNGLPHLLIPDVITEVDKAISALSWVINEMERRFVCFMNFNAKNIDDYNKSKEVVAKLHEKMPYIIIIVDELADFMQQNKKEMEEHIKRLTAKARAAGIYLVLATQRPSVDIITGTIKANLPSRIAFRVSANQDSRTILGTAGAERLLGRGDMLFHPADMQDPMRLQGAYISNREIEKVVNFVKENNESNFDEQLQEDMFNKYRGYEINQNEEEFDPLFKDAVRIIIKTNSASISKLQRAFGIGYPRAGKIIDQIEKTNMISSPDNKNTRIIYVTQQEFEERFGEDL